MPDLTPTQLRSIISELSRRKEAAELDALEFRARCSTLQDELDEARQQLSGLMPIPTPAEEG